ncbi:Anion exchange family protein [Aspergillus sclerotialis]|uniref:Anion exchange family protein n=1 Tax=Aspergillus sclerotialis TaxID=2070753 RepID=A0A3A2ZXJ6_9EURO|nr:Anion exchange family protein [Aspergillus sclerotialis]
MAAEQSPPITREKSTVSYSYDNLTGWKSVRVLRIGRGMYHDVRRRLPYYWSDIRDAWTYRTIASIVRMYFVNMLPAIAYTLDMHRRTGNFYGINEGLFSSALAAMVFSIFACQPLTIVGVTGLISLFNYTIFDIINLHDPSIYPKFMAWVGIWSAIFHWAVAVCNICDYMRYVTDFSSQSFAMYVGIIYIIKGVEELVNEFSSKGLSAGYMGCMIAILYFLTIYGLESLGSSTIGRVGLRTLLADYAYAIGTLFWVGFSHFPGNLKSTHINFVPISRAFYPTQPRPWLIDFWNLNVKWIFVALPFGFLVMLLFYYDHVRISLNELKVAEMLTLWQNISSLTAQARQFPLKKPAGFHWDFFLLGCTTFISGIIGLPFPNGLVPQAPVHTDSLTVYKTNLRIIPTEEGEGAEIRRPEFEIAAVVEQRVSHFVMGLGIIGTMTGPILIVLHTMPNAVFAGVFFTVGWGSIESNGIVQKAVYLIRENRFIQRDVPLLRVRNRKILLFISCQVICVAACVAISQTIAAIGFPVLIIALIPFRAWVIPKWFSQDELSILDELTANNKAVLASFGGAPRFPGEPHPDDYGEERGRRSVERQRSANIHR